MQSKYGKITHHMRCGYVLTFKRWGATNTSTITMGHNLLRKIAGNSTTEVWTIASESVAMPGSVQCLFFVSLFALFCSGGAYACLGGATIRPTKGKNFSKSSITLSIFLFIHSIAFAQIYMYTRFFTTKYTRDKIIINETIKRFLKRLKAKNFYWRNVQNNKRTRPLFETCIGHFNYKNTFYIKQNEFGAIPNSFTRKLIIFFLLGLTSFLFL